jgi:hypothetical protein
MNADPKPGSGGDEKESAWEIQDEAILLPKWE